MYEIGDPHIEWEEANSAREPYPDDSEELEMDTIPFENLKNAVVKFLVSDYDLTMDEAEEMVSESTLENPEMWNDNAEAKDLAKYLASEGNDD